jgi:hypothetical protein
MEYSNTAVLLMVVAVAAVVLGLVFAGTYWLNRVVDENAP